MRDWMIFYVLPTLCLGAFGAIGAAIKNMWNRQKAQEAGILALLHDRLYSSYADCSSKGYATVDDIKNLEYLYNPYHELGGNGTGTELFERVKSMPTTPPKENKEECKQCQAF